VSAPTPRLALTSTGDIDFSSGKLVIETDPVKNVVGKVTKVLLLAQGSWFLAAAKGVPWVQKILGVKNPDLRLVQNILVDAILGVPEVASVENASVTFDVPSRTCTFSGALRTTVGAIPVTVPLAIP
jgi:hypothetical protein